jgi:hypothetical protein
MVSQEQATKTTHYDHAGCADCLRCCPAGPGCSSSSVAAGWQSAPAYLCVSQPLRPCRCAYKQQHHISLRCNKHLCAIPMTTTQLVVQQTVWQEGFISAAGCCITAVCIAAHIEDTIFVYTAAQVNCLCCWRSRHQLGASRLCWLNPQCWTHCSSTG